MVPRLDRGMHRTELRKEVLQTVKLMGLKELSMRMILLTSIITRS